MGEEYIILDEWESNIITHTRKPNKHWKKMKVPQLREKMDHLGINNRGKRPELVERLEEYYSNLQIDSERSEWLDGDSAEEMRVPAADIRQSIAMLTEAVCNMNAKLDSILASSSRTPSSTKPNVDQQQCQHQNHSNDHLVHHQHQNRRPL